MADRPRVLLLPDFIGHPFCFEPVREIDTRCEVRVADYHLLYPYADIPALAAAVVRSLEGWRPDLVIGYSFGGLVGLELLSGIDQAPLVMIDSHRVVHPEPAQADGWSRPRFVDMLPPDLGRLVDALVELGEIREDCVRHNLALFVEHVPRGGAACLHLVRCLCNPPNPALTTDWEDWAGQLQVHALPTTHWQVMKHPRLVPLLLATLHAAASDTLHSGIDNP